ncbi:MAG: glycoside hydrolase family 28 protein, partial [Fimbriimonadales bacterium]
MITILTLALVAPGCLLTRLPAFPLTPSSVFDIRQFGAVGDGKTMATHALQSAIDDAAKAGGVVRIPAGQYLTGTIHLRSSVELHLEKGATLLGSAHLKDYDRGLWRSLILAKNAHNVAITGEGTIDGRGDKVIQDVLRMVDTGEIKIPPKRWRPSEVDRTEVIEMTACHGIRIEGVTLEHSSCWLQVYRRCSDLTVKGVHVDNRTYWNCDGIDVCDCLNVRIEDCDIDADDDGICLKSETRDSRCENVVIENCRVRSSASAIKFGTASLGGFRHIRIKGISVRDTFRSVVALESVDGGVLEDVVAEDVHAVNTGNAFFIRLGHRNLKAPVGRVRHITLRDFDVQVPAGRPDEGYPFHGPFFAEPHNICPASIMGHSEVPIEDVLLEQIKIRMPGGGKPSVAYRPIDKLDLVPERPTEYPEFSNFGELPAWALFARHVRGLRITGMTVEVDKPDYRPAFVADDVADVGVDGVA